MEFNRQNELENHKRKCVQLKLVLASYVAIEVCSFLDGKYTTIHIHKHYLHVSTKIYYIEDILTQIYLYISLSAALIVIVVY